MVAERRARRYWLEIGLIFAAWTVYGLLLANEIRIQSWLFRAHPAPWRIALRNGLFDAYPWAFSTLVIFWLSRRVTLERGHMARRILVHLLAAVVLLFARAGFLYWFGRQVRWLNPRPFSGLFWGSLSVNFLFYALLLGIAHAVLYYERYREGERNAERLTAGLTEARLQALKMQLQPHFLFNTLNAISALIPADAKPARQMVARLGDLLRISLEHEETQEVTLREELAFLEPYLEIEQARLEDRLTVTMRIATETMEIRVPHLLLQPLVENAIRHGIASRIEPGNVQISAALTSDGRTLQLEVRDDGNGVERDVHARTRKGVGLANVQSRLEQLYGREHRFALVNHPEGGVVVKISLPVRARDASGDAGDDAGAHARGDAQ